MNLDFSHRDSYCKPPATTAVPTAPTAHTAALTAAPTAPTTSTAVPIAPTAPTVVYNKACYGRGQTFEPKHYSLTGLLSRGDIPNVLEYDEYFPLVFFLGVTMFMSDQR